MIRIGATLILFGVFIGIFAFVRSIALSERPFVQRIVALVIYGSITIGLLIIIGYSLSRMVN